MKRFVGLLMVAAAVLATASWAAAQNNPPVDETRGKVILSWEEFVKITGYDPAKKGDQRLTIPWAEVEKLLGVKVEQVGGAATVDLPWQEFKALLEWSIRQKDKKDETPPPTDYIVGKSELSGTLSDEGASFTLKVEVNILREKGWKRVPLLPGTVALTEAKLPEGVFLNSSGGNYELLTDKTGKVEATLSFDVAVQKSAGVNQVGFGRVDPGALVMDLNIDRENVDVKVPQAQSLVTKSADGKTHVAAALPTGVPVGITWERALPKVEAAPTKLYAETRTLVAVADDMLLCEEVVGFNILHTAIRELKLQVPQGASVLTVTGPGVEDWRVGDDREMLVVLSREALGAMSVRVTYEAPGAAKVDVPVIRAKGVERERGFIGVIAVANVEITSTGADGATSIDVRQLPPDIVAMTNQPILLAFRYVAEAFTIPLTVRKHDEIGVLVTIVDSGLFTAMQLPDGRRMTKVIYGVRNNRNQFLRLKMPAGAQIWSLSVSGNPASPAKDEAGNVLVPLVRSAAGATELSAFPVEIVYVETPAEAAKPQGTLRVELPVCAVPVMHVMYSYYLPPEGKYESWGKANFSGPLKVVEDFAKLTVGRAAEPVQVDLAQETRQMAEQFAARVEAQTRAAGGSPIRVSLPVNGRLFKLEKILALQQDELWFELEYSGWKTDN